MTSKKYCEGGMTKMAYKEVEQEICEFGKKGDSIEGTFLEAIDGQYGSNFLIDTTDGVKTVYGKTVLKSKMARVKDGSKVRITYLGEIKGDKNTYQDFKVEVDE